ILQPVHGVVNDSSFAVTFTPSSRFVFFQDINGTIRYAVSSSTSISTQQWVADTSLFVNGTADARNNTPIAATYSGYGVVMCYVTVSDVVSCLHLLIFEGIIDILPLPTIPAGSQSRSLSLVTMHGNDTFAFTTWNLFVEDSNRVAQAWYWNGSLILEGVLTNIANVTEHLTNQLRDPANGLRGPLHAPFTSGLYYNEENLPGDGAQLLFTATALNISDPESSNYVTLTPGFETIENSTSEVIDWFFLDNYDITQPVPQDEFDVVLCYTGPDEVGEGSLVNQYFTFWVNGTILASITARMEQAAKSPEKTFPFKRLAGSSYNSTNNIYVYHQLDSVTIAEEVYSIDIDYWTSSNNITVATA
ncbi:hypothetical protein MMC25_007912, partial [Agyrium rufum]|nr:hypothetical protein [Agyrium rufum]